MAHLVVKNDRVQLQLSRWESIAAIHRSPEVSLAEIDSIEIIDNPWSSKVLKGFRIGSAFPFLFLLGTMKYLRGRDFCAMYKRRPTAIIRLKSGPFTRWIFEIKDMSEIDSLKKALAQ